MLATQPFPASPFNSLERSEEVTQYRPVKDLDAFNAILPPAIEFVEGSSSGGFAVDAAYEPINGTPKTLGSARERSHSRSPRPSARPAKPTPKKKSGGLYTGALDTSWPSGVTRGTGLHNQGNTCFLNSALQCLIHTPALVRVIEAHSKTDPCRSKGVCIACSFRSLMEQCFKQTRPIAPYDITNKLQYIAKHMRKGRQEDSHEFLRYMVDALQKACLAGLPPKIDPKVAEATWVHKIFGGRLRSRVHCRACGHNSDTFDRVLDLSVDISRAISLRDALKQFVEIDVLKGADKYKCEKCKKPVVAEKRFTIDEAPLVLTIHLKRFSPLGKKIGHLVQYAERLTLEPYMSEGEFGPAYSLYGVISHAGGGPHSGHYYAHVKAGDGHWYEMNDESVQRVHAAPTDRKSAYVLFYVRERGQALQAAIGSSAVREEKAQAPLLPPAIMKVGIKAAMKKRKISQGNEDDENRGTKTPRTDASSSPLKAKKPFIGPLLPKSASVVGDSSPGGLGTPHPDPQAMTLGKKIAAVKAAAVPEPKASPALASLVQYDDSDEEDLGESVGELPMPASHTQAPPELVPTLNLHGTGAMRGQKLETPFPRSSSPAMKGEKFKIASPAGLVNNDTVATNNDDGSGSDSDDYVDAPSSAASSAIAARVRTPLSPSRPRPRTGTGGGHFSLGTGVHRGRPSFGGGNPFSKLVGSNNLHDRRSPHKRPAHKYGRHHRRH